jgi:hypothetical protein
MINDNTAIIGTLKVAMDTFTLAQGRQKGAIPATTLERLARGDKSVRFQTREQHERFRGLKTDKNPPKHEVSSNRGDDSQSMFEVTRNPPKRQFGSRSCSKA